MPKTAVLALGVALGVSQVQAAPGLMTIAAWPTGANCVDQGLDRGVPYIRRCDGAKSQQWELSSDGLVRSAAGNCLEYTDTDNKVTVVPCDTSRLQKWYVGAGLLKPLGYATKDGITLRADKCLHATATSGTLVLYGCHQTKSQQFKLASMPTVKEDILQATGGSWGDGTNCIEYNSTADALSVSMCTGLPNQRWSFSSKNEVKLAATTGCLDYDLRSSKVSVRACSGEKRQQWTVRDDSRISLKGLDGADGLILQNMCLDPGSTRWMAQCEPTWSNQQFTSRAMPVVDGFDTLDLLKTATLPVGENCVSYDASRQLVYAYQCFGDSNQLWQLTRDGFIRSASNFCLEFSDDNAGVTASRCDSTRRHKWYVASQLIKPQGFNGANGWTMRMDKCLELSARGLALGNCNAASTAQNFSALSPTTVVEDVVQLAGPWANGKNCLQADLPGDRAEVGSCHAQRNQRWSLTTQSELKLEVENKCLEHDGQERVSVRTCSGDAKQKWVVLDDGHVQPRGYFAADGSFVTTDKCLDADATSSYGQLRLATCVAYQPNQKFHSTAIKPNSKDSIGTKDLIRVQGPMASGKNCVDILGDNAIVTSCNSNEKQLWEFTADDQLRSPDNLCLEFSSTDAVAVRICDRTRATQKWRSTAAGSVKPRGFVDAGVSYPMTAKCLEADAASNRLAVAECNNQPNQKFVSRVLPTLNADLVFAVGAATRDANCVARDGTNVVVRSCLAGHDQVWEFTATSEIKVNATQCLTAASNGLVQVASCSGGVTQQWQYTGSGALKVRLPGGTCMDWNSTDTASFSLAPCKTGVSIGSQAFSSSIFSSASGQIGELTNRTSALSEAVLADKFLTERVLKSAEAVVKEADRLAASTAVGDSERGKLFLLEFLFQTNDVDDYSVPVDVLYATAESRAFLLLTSVLLQHQVSPVVLEWVQPFANVFSDQLFDARYAALREHVLSGDVTRVEAYMDGTFSDFDQLGGTLATVCRDEPFTSLSMCTLTVYFELVDTYMVMRQRLLFEGAGRISGATATFAARVIDLYTMQEFLIANDPVWTPLMTLLLFRTPYVKILTEAELQRTGQPELYLPTLVLHSFFGTHAALAPFDEIVRFISDQVTNYHVDKLLAIAATNSISTLAAYITEPADGSGIIRPGSNSSDFSVLAKYVTQLSCADDKRVPLSLCQLDAYRTGLQVAIRFDEARRSNIVDLGVLMEVDVRKRLDVIYAEKDQFELLTTLLDVANKVGTGINQGVSELKTQIANSTSLIRADIEASRKQLTTVIGTVGQALQSTIEASTVLLYDTIEEKTSEIRDDIQESSRQLSTQLNDVARQLSDEIEQSKQELKYLIGAEAEQTRTLINKKTEELKQHMSSEAQGIKSHIDTRTKEIVGVVEREGRATRDHVTQKTGELRAHITSEANGIKAKVDTAWKDIVAKQEAGFKSVNQNIKNTQTQIRASTDKIIESNMEGVRKLAKINQADCIDNQTSTSDFSVARERYTKSLDEIKTSLELVKLDLAAIVNDGQRAITNWKGEGVTRGVGTVLSGILSAVEGDYAGVIGGMFSLRSDVAQYRYADAKDVRVKKAGEMLQTIADQGVKVADSLGSNAASAFGKALAALANGETLHTSIYDAFKADIRPAEAGDLIANIEQVMNMVADILIGYEDAGNIDYAEEVNAALDICYNLENSVGGVADRLRDAFQYIDEMRAAIKSIASSGARCQSANDAAKWGIRTVARIDIKNIIGRRRQLQTTVPSDPNEPFYAMRFTALTKIVLDYRIQEAAFQFCKFFEYKNGGVAPSVCGRPGEAATYTITQIQEMRAYRPPVLRRVDMRALLPTTRVYNADKGLYYPFVDLYRLRAGVPMTFTLPTWDIAWLKKMNWLFPSIDEKNVPSVYVESMRLYLPFDAGNATNEGVGGAPFAMSVKIESLEKQVPSWHQRDRVYQLPRQSFLFESWLAQPLCASANKVPYPYHELATCLQTDGTSEVCMRERGAAATQNDLGLLPSLFSTWRITAEFDRTPTAAYNLTVPKRNVLSDTTVGEMLTNYPGIDLVADLTVVQVSASGTNAVARAPASINVESSPLCCGPNEYRVSRTKCQKCVNGTRAVLHGYTCAA